MKHLPLFLMICLIALSLSAPLNAAPAPATEDNYEAASQQLDEDLFKWDEEEKAWNRGEELKQEGETKVVAKELVMPASKPSQMHTPPKATSMSKAVTPLDEGDELVSMSSSRLLARVANLEQRITMLEKTNGFQEDQIRRLNRSIDDVKRRT